MLAVDAPKGGTSSDQQQQADAAADKAKPARSSCWYSPLSRQVSLAECCWDVGAGRGEGDGGGGGLLSRRPAAAALLCLGALLLGSLASGLLAPGCVHTCTAASDFALQQPNSVRYVACSVPQVTLTIAAACCLLPDSHGLAPVQRSINQSLQACAQAVALPLVPVSHSNGSGTEATAASKQKQRPCLIRVLLFAALPAAAHAPATAAGSSSSSRTCR